MNASLKKRLLAYLIDILIVSVVFSLCTLNYSDVKIESYDNEVSTLTNDFVSGKISSYNYLSGYADIVYDIQYESLYRNIIYLVICVGYFMIFQYLNKGQTVGKKLMGIRVVDKDNDNVSFLQMFIRTCIINEIMYYLMTIILVIFANRIVLLAGYGLLGLVNNLVIIISFIMIVRRNDNRGIHDMLSHTHVVEIGRDE